MAGGNSDRPVEKIGTFDRDATLLSAYDFHLTKCTKSSSGTQSRRSAGKSIGVLRSIFG
jgi:hypothetical protein